MIPHSTVPTISMPSAQESIAAEPVALARPWRAPTLALSKKNVAARNAVLVPARNQRSKSKAQASGKTSDEK